GKDSTIPGNPSYNPTLPQYESGSDHSTTHATISPGQITINGKQTSVEELGIHSDIDSAHSKVSQLPDLQQIMDKQQAVADATATIANSVRTLSADMARKANQERQQAREKAEQELQTNNPELWQDYNQLSEDKKQLVLRETSKDYRAADEQAQSWGIGGGKSRALNAVTSAVTGILGGQTNLQAATNALAPYAAELIGKQFGHGDNQNQAAQLVAHALLGAISASVNGGNVAAGAVGASAAELAAQYLIKQLPKDQYPEAIDPRTGEIDPNRLPESVKASIRDLSSAVATVSGGLTGGSLINAQIAGVAGQNAVENNYLSDAQAAQEQKELKQCTNIGCTAKVKTQWTAISAAQQASFTAGIVIGLPAETYDVVKELVHMTTNPGETYQALKGLFTSGNILGNVSDAVKESYINRLNKLEEEYQRAGAGGSYNAGIETGKLLLDMAALATGVGGAAKAGIKVTEKAITKVANAAKKEVIEAGKGAGKGASIIDKGKIGVPVTKAKNPLNPVQQYDAYGNEIVYRTMSQEHYEQFLNTGKLPATTETSVSPVLGYSSKYDGVTIKIAVKPGTFSKLEEIGIAANSATVKEFPNMSTQTGKWMQTNTRFKVEKGQMTTQLGQGKGMEIFNNNIVHFEKVK
ncbi:VENN motif pre-toxin domain-containing protein, partial [Snodgrassella gandavensis]|uniref:VENN motif pre-toxin domain-containing protein n=1 Tax=Snodgrassella gandavensis TaxID=2946698 RepID=UPI001EF4303F